MKIAVVGAGYVGLVSGACLADFGFDVTLIDHDLDRVARLQRGRDLRNLYSPVDIARTCFVYHSLGRAVLEPHAVEPA